MFGKQKTKNKLFVLTVTIMLKIRLVRKCVKQNIVLNCGK